MNYYFIEHFKIDIIADVILISNDDQNRFLIETRIEFQLSSYFQPKTSPYESNWGLITVTIHRVLL